MLTRHPPNGSAAVSKKLFHQNRKLWLTACSQTTLFYISSKFTTMLLLFSIKKLTLNIVFFYINGICKKTLVRLLLLLTMIVE